MISCAFVAAFTIFSQALSCTSLYNGEKSKHLYEQNWTGHLATVTVVLNLFRHVASLLQKMATSRAHKAQTRIETLGLLQKVQEQSLLFVAKILYKVYNAM